MLLYVATVDYECCVFFFKQKTAYEMRISDWSSDVCSSDLLPYRPGVGVMLRNRQRHVFVGQRIDSTAEAWQMPQGGIDKGEEPRVTALREMEEETGTAPRLVEIVTETPGWLTYDLPEDLVGKLWKGRYRGQRQKWYLARFLGADSDVNLATRSEEHTSELKSQMRNS